LREGDICTAFSGHKSVSRKTLGIVSGGVKKLISQTVPWLPQESLFLFGWKRVEWEGCFSVWGSDVASFGDPAFHIPPFARDDRDRHCQSVHDGNLENKWKGPYVKAKDGKCIFERN
jgi:hypothetical protein